MYVYWHICVWHINVYVCNIILMHCTLKFLASKLSWSRLCDVHEYMYVCVWTHKRICMWYHFDALYLEIFGQQTKLKQIVVDRCQVLWRSAHLYVCMYVCVYIMCVCTFVRVRMSGQVRTCMYVWMYACMCVHELLLRSVTLYACMNACMVLGMVKTCVWEADARHCV